MAMTSKAKIFMTKRYWSCETRAKFYPDQYLVVESRRPLFGWDLPVSGSRE